MKTLFTKDEWFEVAKIAKPGISEQTYDAMWADFIRFKALPKEQQRVELDAM